MSLLPNHRIATEQTYQQTVAGVQTTFQGAVSASEQTGSRDQTDAFCTVTTTMSDEAVTQAAYDDADL